MRGSKFDIFQSRIASQRCIAALRIMSPFDTHRRNFLKVAGAAAGATLLSPSGLLSQSATAELRAIARRVLSTSAETRKSENSGLSLRLQAAVIPSRSLTSNSLLGSSTAEMLQIDACPLTVQ